MSCPVNCLGPLKTIVDTVGQDRLGHMQNSWYCRSGQIRTVGTVGQDRLGHLQDSWYCRSGHTCRTVDRLEQLGQDRLGHMQDSCRAVRSGQTRTHAGQLISTVGHKRRTLSTAVQLVSKLDVPAA